VLDTRRDGPALGQPGEVVMLRRSA